jgi:hypothetical protein
MVTSVKIERYKDYDELMLVVSRDPACPATDKDLVRPLNYEMLVGTHVPEQYQFDLGALIRLLFRDPAVKNVEVWQTDGGSWVANAFVVLGRRERLKRGEGETPVQAMIELITDIQRY